MTWPASLAAVSPACNLQQPVCYSKVIQGWKAHISCSLVSDVVKWPESARSILTSCQRQRLEQVEIYFLAVMEGRFLR